MTKLQRQVLEFHRAFDHPVADSPTIPADDRVRFRAAFIVEECLEFLEACFDEMDDRPSSETGNRASMDIHDAKVILNDMIKNCRPHVDLPLAVDALADIDYVVEGCRLEFGVNGEPIADEVHRANMTKVGAPRTPEGKTLKPPGWAPPDIVGELEKQRNGWSLGDEIGNAKQMQRIHELPPMTALQKDEQALDLTYGNLAIDGKVSRDAFKTLATNARDLTYNLGFGWTEQQFDAWADGKKWNDDGK